MKRIDCPEPGVYRNIPGEEYHSWDAVSMSGFKYLDASPAHYRAFTEKPPPSTDAMAFGSMLHKLALETIDFDAEYAVAPEGDRRTKAGKEKWAKFEEAAQGKIVVKREDYDTARAMAKAIQKHSLASKLLAGGETEISLVWDDVDTQVRCKGRLDRLIEKGIADLKSAADASEEAFGRAITRYRYYRQAAFYLDGAKANGFDVEWFAFIAAEKAFPFGVTVWDVSANSFVVGRKNYKRHLYTVKACLESGRWDNYDERLYTFEPPNWLLREEGLLEEQEISA